MPTPWTRVQVPIDALMDGSIAERLIAFYRAFGPTALGGYVQVWTADEIATVIGLRGGNPKRTVQKTRDRLVADGKLIKVERGGLYTWDYAWQGISDEALAILNSKLGAQANHVWTRREESWKASLVDYPVVRLMNLPGRPAWWRVLPDLLETDEETQIFWTTKIESAVNNEKALSHIKGESTKIQAALYAIESGIQRNLESNPDWRPASSVAFVLSMITRAVGTEDTWALPNPDQQAEIKEAETTAPLLTDYIVQQASTKVVPKGVWKELKGRVGAIAPTIPEGVTPITYKGHPVIEVIEVVQPNPDSQREAITDDLMGYIERATAHQNQPGATISTECLSQFAPDDIVAPEPNDGDEDEDETDYREDTFDEDYRDGYDRSWE